jgi:hypothetical protein
MTSRAPSRIASTTTVVVEKRADEDERQCRIRRVQPADNFGADHVWQPVVNEHQIEVA